MTSRLPIDTRARIFEERYHLASLDTAWRIIARCRQAPVADHDAVEAERDHLLTLHQEAAHVSWAALIKIHA